MRKLLLLWTVVALILASSAILLLAGEDEVKVIYCPLTLGAIHASPISVAVLNIDTGSVNAYALANNYPASITVDSEYNAWLGGNPGAKIDMNGNILATTAGVLEILQARVATDDSIWTLVMDAVPNYYQAHYNSSGVLLFQSGILGPGAPVGGNHSPGRTMTIDLDGNIWFHGVISPSRDVISKRSPTGVLLALNPLPSALYWVQDMKADGLGNIWIVDANPFTGQGYLRRCSTDAVPLNTYNAPVGQNYMGLAIDSNNKISVTCNNNRVYRISQTGVVEQTYVDAVNTLTMFLSVGGVDDDFYYGHSVGAASGLVRLNNDATFQEAWNLTLVLGNHMARGNGFFESVGGVIISLIG